MEDWELHEIPGNIWKIENFMTVLMKAKVKVKFTLEQATKAQIGSRGIALRFP